MDAFIYCVGCIALLAVALAVVVAVWIWIAEYIDDRRYEARSIAYEEGRQVGIADGLEEAKRRRDLEIRKTEE